MLNNCHIATTLTDLPECLPYVVSQTVQPKECAQQGHVQNNVGHHKTNMTAEFSENAHQISCLANNQTDGNSRDNVANQVTIYIFCF